MMMDGRTDTHWMTENMITIAHHEHFVLRSAKKQTQISLKSAKTGTKSHSLDR